MAVFYGRGISPAGHIHTGSALSILLVLLPLIQFRDEKSSQLPGLSASLDSQSFFDFGVLAASLNRLMFIVISFCPEDDSPFRKPALCFAAVVILRPYRCGNRQSVEPAPEDIPKPAIILSSRYRS